MGKFLRGSVTLKISVQRRILLIRLLYNSVFGQSAAGDHPSQWPSSFFEECELQAGMLDIELSITDKYLFQLLISDTDISPTPS